MKADINRFDQLIRKALLLLKANNSYADTFLVSEKQIRALNKKFRGKDKETNVLSFPFPENFPQPRRDKRSKRFLGEIYLCPAYIKEHNESMDFMVIHGLLHLLGFDHVRHSDRIEMERLENSLMSFLTNHK